MRGFLCNWRRRFEDRPWVKGGHADAADLVRAGRYQRAPKTSFRRLHPCRGYPTMNKSAAERAEISRRNGRKSTGPRSAEGKDRSRFNALKHGLKAQLPVLPGEDAQDYQGRLDAWISDWQPRDHVEQTL